MNFSKDNRRQVLFQKLNKKWYAFTEGDDGPVFVALPDGVDPKNEKFEFYEILEETLEKIAPNNSLRKRSPENSAAS